eukprot:scaffold10833_cov114-Skeletonema_marinoi.AAC.2
MSRISNNRLVHRFTLGLVGSHLMLHTCCALSSSTRSFLHKGRFANIIEDGGGGEVVVPFDTSWLPTEILSAVAAAETLLDKKEENDNAASSCASSTTVLPDHLSPPMFVDVFDYNDLSYNVENDGVGKEESLSQLGREARSIIDDALDTKRNSEDVEDSTINAVLFRGLSNCIQTAQDFKKFWSGCIDGAEGQNEMTYVPFGKGRNTLDGVDLVTPFPPSMALKCHNEMSYNPRPAGRIAFYCLEAASKGGETILARNADLTKYVSTELQQFVKEHGGILYRREYYDERRNPNPSSDIHRHMGSWQKKTGTNDEKDAIKGTLIVENVHPGVIKDDDDREVWFNVLYMGLFKLADGISIPSDMLQQLMLDEWRAVHVLKLHPGDWIVLNNQSVQHGRLPFVDGPDQKRTILTVYTD